MKTPGAVTAEKRLAALPRDSRGATAVEYSLVALLVVMAIVLAVAFLGTALGNFFGYLGYQVPAL